VARLSTMPTIPDEQVPDFDLPPLDVDPESDYRCKLGQTQRGAVEPALLTRALPANRELSIKELLRYPTLLAEDVTLGVAAQLFASGMEEPVVLITNYNGPLGILDAASVLRSIRGLTVEEIEQTRVLDVITPGGLILDEEASLLQAAECFIVEDCDALVVVNGEGELAGVLMARDVFLLWV
jgi:predicted transcriptional regulator